MAKGSYLNAEMQLEPFGFRVRAAPGLNRCSSKTLETWLTWFKISFAVGHVDLVNILREAGSCRHNHESECGSSNLPKKWLNVARSLDAAGTTRLTGMAVALLHEASHIGNVAKDHTARILQLKG